jgi:two-component system, NarL family, invasion response regulator UvrY
MQVITLIITDDHILVRQAFVSLFNADKRFRVLDHCGSGEEAILATRRLRPDVLLMDINLPGMNGFETCTKILASRATDVKILAVSVNAEYTYARKMFQCGAMGYITKNSPIAEIFKAVIEIYNDRKYICTEIKDKLSLEMLEQETDSEPIKPLKQGEIELIHLISQGLTSKEIAAQVGLSLKTIEGKRHSILKKLRLPNVAALVNFASSLP